METRITDPLFLLTQKEIAPNASQTSESSMKPYRYYSGSGDSNANRQKKQIKGSSGAIGATLIAD
ncbi:MAG: hypothetical protein MJ201_01065 [Mycoplasmoidaceae bacterium]|nr:hypothetical protein [Mycoplasmoidaceae bacterium]